MTRRTGYEIDHGVLKNSWENAVVFLSAGPAYTEDELEQACRIAKMRAGGLSLQEIRKSIAAVTEGGGGGTMTTREDVAARLSGMFPGSDSVSEVELRELERAGRLPTFEAGIAAAYFRKAIVWIAARRGGAAPRLIDEVLGEEVGMVQKMHHYPEAVSVEEYDRRVARLEKRASEAGDPWEILQKRAAPVQAPTELAKSLELALAFARVFGRPTDSIFTLGETR
ncbi:MAG TPA: hypothetical protein VFX78_03645 [Candidatus Eisenbacteria bacterium]|nr:hypothetical protein [Candidatus Eisenbacteria bacterium]